MFIEKQKKNIIIASWDNEHLVIFAKKNCSKEHIKIVLKLLIIRIELCPCYNIIPDMK